MALCYSLFNYTNVRLALFKGDDSAVACDSYVMNNKANSILKLTGHKLKLHSFTTGEFAGWFLTPYGMFPNVIRYAAKFISKTYRDREHFEESQKSLGERMSTVHTEQFLNYACCAATEHFHNVTAEQLYCISKFLIESRQYKFKDLKPVNQPLLR
jgi:hypothetical protein